MVNYSLSGREVTFDDCKGGAHPGKLAALDGQPRSAYVVAYLSQKGFHDLLHNYPQVAVRIPRNLAKIVRISTDRIIDLSTVGSNKRLQAKFLRLAKPSMKVENTGEI